MIDICIVVFYSILHREGRQNFKSVRDPKGVNLKRIIVFNRLAKCKGARERRSKKAGILQRKNGLNLI